MCGTITHPEYNEYTRKNDIAILRLCKYVNFNERTKMSPACLPSSKDNNYENIMVSIDSSFILCLWTLIGFVAQATVSTWASHPSGGKKLVEVNTMTNDQVGWQEIILIFDLITSIDYRFIFQCINTDITKIGGISADMLCTGGYNSQHLQIYFNTHCVSKL